MSDKVIIDGVDVSECGFFHPEYGDKYCHIALAFSEEYSDCMECKDNPDCYFKQLQRLKAENEELKEELKRQEEDISTACVDCANLQNLSNALEKIREVAKTVINSANCNNCDGVGYYDGCKDINCGDYAIRKIFDKINEVLK